MPIISVGAILGLISKILWDKHHKSSSSGIKRQENYNCNVLNVNSSVMIDDYDDEVPEVPGPLK